MAFWISFSWLMMGVIPCVTGKDQKSGFTFQTILAMAAFSSPFQQLETGRLKVSGKFADFARHRENGLKQLHLGLLGLRAVDGGGGAFGFDWFGVGGGG